MLRRAALALFALLAATSLKAQTLIANDTWTSFDIPGQSVVADLAFDAPPGTRSLEFRLEAVSPGGPDLDLLVRSESPFRFATPDFEMLLAQSQYYSISPTDQEFIAIGESNLWPAREGRWHIAVVNFANGAVTARVRVRASASPPSSGGLAIDYASPGSNCSVAEWDQNPQRRTAFENAVNRLANLLPSPVPIRIRACWRDYGPDSGTLASAGPNGYYRDFPGALRRNTFYSRAATARLAGTELCRLGAGSCGSADLTITFNSRVDDPSRPPTQRWHYGTGNEPVTGFDFASVAMHELLHGLGFVGLIDLENGQLLTSPRDDIYAFHAFRSPEFPPVLAPQRRLTAMSDGDRLAAVTSENELYFDALGVVFPNTAPGQLYPINLHAPSSIQRGSSFSHIGFYVGTSEELMFPSVPPNRQRRTLGLAEPIMRKLGWDASARTPPSHTPPRNGLWFDPTRDGHGYEFSRSGPNHVLITYTYGADGTPEYYLGTGRFVDGRFVPDVNPSGNGLIAYLYDAARTPPQYANPDPAASGNALLDFVQPDTDPSCRRETALRADADALHVFSWELPGGEGSWCVKPLLPYAWREAQTNDFTGLWYAGESDPGYGLSITTGRDGDRIVLFAVLYYPDAQGKGRWVYAFSDNFRSGDTLPLVQRRAYCRTCASASFQDRTVGQIRLILTQPSFSPSAGNAVEFSLNVPDGPAAGSFQRSLRPIQLITDPGG